MLTLLMATLVCALAIEVAIFVVLTRSIRDLERRNPWMRADRQRELARPQLADPLPRSRLRRPHKSDNL